MPFGEVALSTRKDLISVPCAAGILVRTPSVSTAGGNIIRGCHQNLRIITPLPDNFFIISRPWVQPQTAVPAGIRSFKIDDATLSFCRIFVLCERRIGGQRPPSRTSTRSIELRASLGPSSLVF